MYEDTFFENYRGGHDLSAGMTPEKMVFLKFFEKIYDNCK